MGKLGASISPTTAHALARQPRSWGPSKAGCRPPKMQAGGPYGKLPPRPPAAGKTQRGGGGKPPELSATKQEDLPCTRPAPRAALCKLRLGVEGAEKERKQTHQGPPPVKGEATLPGENGAVKARWGQGQVGSRPGGLCSSRGQADGGELEQTLQSPTLYQPLGPHSQEDPGATPPAQRDSGPPGSRPRCSCPIPPLRPPPSGLRAPAPRH